MFVELQCGNVVEMTDAQYADHINNVLGQWFEASSQLKQLKAVEMELRKYAIMLIHDQNSEKSVLELGNGWQAISRTRETLAFEKGVNVEQIKEVFEYCKNNEHTQLDLFSRAVNITPTLNIAVYQQLSGKTKELMDSMIVSKPTTPTLQIEINKNEH